MIRLIATDLDGTLLEKNGRLPQGTYEVVQRLMDMGIRFAAASGRQYGNLQRLFGPVAGRMAYVCENGALSMIDGKPAGMVEIDNQTVRELIADFEQLDEGNVMVCAQHTCYMLDKNRAFTDDIVYRLRNAVTIVESWDDITEPVIKVSYQSSRGVQADAPMLLAKWGKTMTATVSGFDWFDVTAANKGTGMQMLMQHMGVQKEEVAAFGDNFNDESMLDLVGHPFLMRHATKALHKPHYHLCEKVLPVLTAIADAKGDMDAALRLLSE